MLKRRRNAGLRLNSTGERGSTVNNSASISSNNASARREKTPSSLWRKVCRSCKGAGVVILPNHRQISNLVKPSGEWALNFRTSVYLFTHFALAAQRLGVSRVATSTTDSGQKYRSTHAAGQRRLQSPLSRAPFLHRRNWTALRLARRNVR